MYVKGLGETYLTLNRRLVLLLYLLLLNVLIKTTTRQGGNFMTVNIFSEKKIQRRTFFPVESARRIIRAFWYKYNTQPGNRAVWAMPATGSTARREAVRTWLCGPCPLRLSAAQSVRLGNYSS